MSLSAAFASAQSTIARATGAPASGVNALYNGNGYVAVWGQPQVVEVMMPGGGYRRRAQLAVTLTRDQFDTAPVSKETITNPLLAATYTIEDVNLHDPFHYVLTVVKAG